MEEKSSWDHSDIIFMEYYNENLEEFITTKRFMSKTIFNKLQIAYKMAKGLCFLSSRGILHRDFKPQNVMLTYDRQLGYEPKIIDFGSCIGV